jgi:hypothetical protein
MQIRHNLVVPEKPFFRRGRCVLKAANHLVEAKTSGVFGMKRSRIVAARAAQDEPAGAADIQLNSAVRNTRAVIAENIEAALVSDVSLAVVVMQG